MKTLRTIAKVAIVVVASWSLASCSKSKSGGSNVRGGIATPGGAYGCAGCSQSNYLYSTLSRNGQGVELVMEHYRATEVDPNYPGGINGYYSGAVTASGALFVNGAIGGYCNLPPDIYDIVEVVGVGNIDANGTLSGLRVKAYGSRTGFEVYLTQLPNFVYTIQSGSQIGCDGIEYTHETIGQWRIDSIAGGVYGNNYYGGYSSCMGATIGFYDARAPRSCPQ